MEDAHKLLKITNSECPDHLDSSTTTQMAQSWSSMEDPVVPLERNLYGHPLAGFFLGTREKGIILICECG